MPATIQKHAAPKSALPTPTIIAQKLNYIEALNAIVDKGRLVSVADHDNLLMNDYHRQLDDQKVLYYPALCREILVYPAVYSTFVKAKDVVDSHKDGTGRQWILNAASVPQEATGIRGIALLVDPQHIHVDSNRVVIEADRSSVTFIAPFLQASGKGRPDERTTLPLDLLPYSDDYQGKRFLWRTNGTGVRTLLRGWPSSKLCIDASTPQNFAAGVGYFSYGSD